MWVTQTYLGNVEQNAKLFVYYLFENYSDEQIRFTRRVQILLEDLGQTFGESVSLLFPNPRYAVQIGSEVRRIQDFWWTLQGKLPALLIATNPLSNFDPTEGDYFLVSFKSKDAKGAAEAVKRLKDLANEYLSWEFANQPAQPEEAWWVRFFDALELKPGFGPVKLDLKKLARR